MIVKINAGLYTILHTNEDKIQMKFSNSVFGIMEEKIHDILYLFGMYCYNGKTSISIIKVHFIVLELYNQVTLILFYFVGFLFSTKDIL